MCELPKKLMAGFVGKDSQREKARKLMPALNHTEKRKVNPGDSEVQKIRLYKKGGSVSKDRPSHKLSKMQKDEYFPGKETLKSTKNRNFMKETSGTMMKHYGGSMMKGETEMKRGGPMKMKKASGGNIYERQMLGERDIKSPKFNYESEMRGEKPVSSKREVASTRMAMGGPGKMRKGEMSKSGKPVTKMAKNKRGY